MTTTIEIKTKKESEIMKTIQQYEKDGWKLVSNTNLVFNVFKTRQGR